MPPSLLLVHPGPQGQYSVVRWTAPTTGTYEIAGSFLGLDSQGNTTTDVHILLNSSTSLFDADVSGFNMPQGFSLTQTVSSGDTIDFVVGLVATEPTPSIAPASRPYSTGPEGTGEAGKLRLSVSGRSRSGFQGLREAECSSRICKSLSPAGR